MANTKNDITRVFIIWEHPPNSKEGGGVDDYNRRRFVPISFYDHQQMLLLVLDGSILYITRHHHRISLSAYMKFEIAATAVHPWCFSRLDIEAKMKLKLKSAHNSR
jgi:hypothetical protein